MNTNNTSLKNQIYTSILNDIIIGVYPPDQVINEKGLIGKIQREPVLPSGKPSLSYVTKRYFTVSPTTDTKSHLSPIRMLPTLKPTEA